MLAIGCVSKSGVRSRVEDVARRSLPYNGRSIASSSFHGFGVPRLDRLETRGLHLLGILSSRMTGVGKEVPSLGRHIEG